LSGLKYFSKVDPTYRAAEIERAVDKAIKWIHSVQRPDGSWYGAWGICFTYATMFALESLSIAGETYSNSSRVRRACEFLVSKQMGDGGWGETYLSCVNMEYSQHDQSQVVMTSWAILALLYAQYPDKEVIRRACRLVMSRQKKDGRWEQEDTEGIFNKNCAIDYPCESSAARADEDKVPTDPLSVQVHLLHLGAREGGQVPRVVSRQHETTARVHCDKVGWAAHKRHTTHELMKHALTSCKSRLLASSPGYR
jgi:hypothetical protein